MVNKLDQLQTAPQIVGIHIDISGDILTTELRSCLLQYTG